MKNDIHFLQELETHLHQAAQQNRVTKRRSFVSTLWREPTRARVHWLPETARLRRRILALASALVVVAGGGIGYILIQSSPAPQVGVLPGPGTGAHGLVGTAGGEELWAVAAASSSDIWAVGSRTAPGLTTSNTLYIHWDGASWQSVDGPDVGTLVGLAVVSPTDAWAVGGSGAESRTASIVHWDGHSWRLVDNPKPMGANLQAVSAASANDVWAVGTQRGNEYGSNSVGLNTLIEHWDGTQWTVTRSPDRSLLENYLTGVVALSASDAWAVGYTQDSSPDPKTLTMHWDGRSWTTVPSPSPGNDYNVLWGVGTDGAGGVWAVGHYGNKGGYLTSLFLRWSGSGWQLVPSASQSNWTPVSVAGVASDDVWAAGSPETSDLEIAHWDGKSWTLVPAPGGGENTSFINALTVVVASDAWAVGGYERTSDHYRPGFVLHWDGSTWEQARVTDK